MHSDSDREKRDEALGRDEAPESLDDDEPSTTSEGHQHGESHATTGGAAAAGAVTGGVVGLTGGPVGAVIGAVGGAILGAAAERVMHGDGDSDRGHHEPAEDDEPHATATPAEDYRPHDVVEPLADAPSPREEYRSNEPVEPHRTQTLLPEVDDAALAEPEVEIPDRASEPKRPLL
jgi:hypothetical protein